MGARIKIYGERNTGTNYLSHLLRLNLEVSELRGTVPRQVMSIQKRVPGNEGVRDLFFDWSFGWTLGWKHSCVKSAGTLKRYRLVRDGLPFVTLTKNPYAWLLSLYRRPYHQYYVEKPDFETFLQTPWRTVGRDNLGTRFTDSPVDLWNRKNASYLRLEGLNALTLTAEQLLTDPAAIINAISRHLSLRRKSPSFVDYEKSTKDAGKGTAYYRDYYLNEKWRDQLSSRAVDIINRQLDPDLVRHFGYRLL